MRTFLLISTFLTHVSVAIASSSSAGLSSDRSFLESSGNDRNNGYSRLLPMVQHKDWNQQEVLMNRLLDLPKDSAGWCDAMAATPDRVLISLQDADRSTPDLSHKMLLDTVEGTAFLTSIVRAVNQRPDFQATCFIHYGRQKSKDDMEWFQPTSFADMLAQNYQVPLNTLVRTCPYIDGATQEKIVTHLTTFITYRFAPMERMYKAAFDAYANNDWATAETQGGLLAQEENALYAQFVFPATLGEAFFKHLPIHQNVIDLIRVKPRKDNLAGMAAEDQRNQQAQFLRDLEEKARKAQHDAALAKEQARIQKAQRLESDRSDLLDRIRKTPKTYGYSQEKEPVMQFTNPRERNAPKIHEFFMDLADVHASRIDPFSHEHPMKGFIKDSLKIDDGAIDAVMNHFARYSDVPYDAPYTDLRQTFQYIRWCYERNLISDFEGFKAQIVGSFLDQYHDGQIKCGTGMRNRLFLINQGLVERVNLQSVKAIAQQEMPHGALNGSALDSASSSSSSSSSSVISMGGFEDDLRRAIDNAGVLNRDMAFDILRDTPRDEWASMLQMIRDGER